MIDKSKPNVKQHVEEKCPECGGPMYYETNGMHEGIFCFSGDYADIDVCETAVEEFRVGEFVSD